MHNAPPAGRPRYARIFWDLDGTLTDPRDGIVRSVRYALEALGRTPDPATLTRFIGPPLARSFGAYYGLEGEALGRAVALYRDRYERIGWRENRLRPGIERLLADLAQRGARMAVATAKPRPMAARILAHFGLSGFFEGVYAAEPDRLGEDKTAVLGRALGGRAWRGPGEAAMIGDHADDIRAARAWGLRPIALRYACGDEAAVRAAGPLAVAEDVDALRRLLLDDMEGGAARDGES